MRGAIRGICSTSMQLNNHTTEVQQTACTLGARRKPSLKTAPETTHPTALRRKHILTTISILDLHTTRQQCSLTTPISLIRHNFLTRNTHARGKLHPPAWMTNTQTQIRLL